MTRRNLIRIVEAEGGDVDFVLECVLGEADLGAAGGADAARAVVARTEAGGKAADESELGAGNREPGDARRPGCTSAHFTVTVGLVRHGTRRFISDRTAVTPAGQHDDS